MNSNFNEIVFVVGATVWFHANHYVSETPAWKSSRFRKTCGLFVGSLVLATASMATTKPSTHGIENDPIADRLWIAIEWVRFVFPILGFCLGIGGLLLIWRKLSESRRNENAGTRD